MTYPFSIRLVMFDMDGTLFDTEKANFLAYREACGEEFPLSEEFFHKFCMSRNYREFLPLLGVPAERLPEIHDKKIQCYQDYFHAVRVNDSLFRMAELFRSQGSKLCVVTTASRTNTLDLLSAFGYAEFFDLLVTQETVANLKPAPDAYVYAMQYFQINAENCVIFEDSPSGLCAAKDSGAVVYSVVQF